MSANSVLIERKGNACFITLNRPDNFNALDLETAQALSTAVAQCHDGEVRAVVITGAGRAFCSGGDLGHFEAAPDLGGALGEVLLHLNRTIIDIRLLDKPVVAAVNGVAAGGGMGLALACDLRIVSEKATFKQGFTSAALVPDSSWSLFAPLLCGLSRACEMVFLDPLLTAQQAEQYGIANRVVPADKLVQEVDLLAQTLAAGATLAFAEAKRHLNQAVLPNLETHLERERQAMIRAGRTQDAREGITAFAEKRPPVFKGR